MIVIYIWGKNVFQHCSLQYCINHFNDLDAAIGLVESRFDLKFKKEPTISLPYYRVYDLVDSDKEVRLIAEVTPLLK